jgi:hypothetical protein
LAIHHAIIRAVWNAGLKEGLLEPDVLAIGKRFQLVEI